MNLPLIVTAVTPSRAHPVLMKPSRPFYRAFKNPSWGKYLFRIFSIERPYATSKDLDFNIAYTKTRFCFSKFRQDVILYAEIEGDFKKAEDALCVAAFFNAQ